MSVAPIGVPPTSVLVPPVCVCVGQCCCSSERFVAPSAILLIVEARVCMVAQGREDAERLRGGAGTSKLSEGASAGAHALATLRLKGCGQLVVYCSQAPLRVALNGEAAQFSFSSDRNVLTVAVPHSKDLLTDAVIEY